MNNYIGVDATGMNGLANGRSGIALVDSTDSLIGGGSAGGGPGSGPYIGQSNVISSNVESSVFIQGHASQNNRVQGNYIGTSKQGLSPLGNGNDGVTIDGGVGNVIGGDDVSYVNVIANNGANGIGVYSEPPSVIASENTLQGNLISNNFLLGIDL